MKKVARLVSITVVILLLTTRLGSAAEYITGFKIDTVATDIKVSSVGTDDFSDVDSGSGWEFFILKQKSPNLRVGGSAFHLHGKASDTTVDISGGGIMLELVYGKRWQIAGGLQVGGASIIATNKERSSSTKEVNEGKFTHADGILASPYLTLGVTFGTIGVDLIAKKVIFITGSEHSEEFGFSTVGLRMRIKLLSYY